MSFEMIQERLKVYYKLEIESASIIELENALKEMVQEIVLRGLGSSGFFKQGVFQGGTCLGILHKSQRFSEDLDFTLKEPDPAFVMEPHFYAAQQELTAFGLASDLQDMGKKHSAVAKGFIKMSSVDKILSVETKIGRRPMVRVRLDVDTNPPAGQETEVKTVLWPSAFPVVAGNIPSLFAGKIHALLSRGYTKGRDWYDLAWYAQFKPDINYVYLKNALIQTGRIKPDCVVDLKHVKASLRERFESININDIKEDAKTFAKDRSGIDLWTKDVFFGVIDSL